MTNRTTFLAIHSFLPLLLGISIYALWRSEHLLGFQWLDLIGLSAPVMEFRASLAVLGQPQEWILYSLPDGLWVYAATSAIGWIWLGNWHKEAWIWVSLPLVLGLCMEAGQRYGLVAGTFSAEDVSAYLIAAIVGKVVLLRKLEKINAPSILT